MRLRLLCSLVLLCGLLLGTVPTEAAHITINPGQPTQLTPDQATYQKIAKLQSYFDYAPLSLISPDDQAQLVLFAKSFSNAVQVNFVNIQDGSVVPVQFQGRPLAPLTEAVWLDNQTVAYLSEQNFRPVAVEINRKTGKVTTARISLPGFPISLSPNGNRLLIAIASFSGQQTQALNLFKSPFDLEIKRNFAQPATASNQFLSQLSPWAAANLNPNLEAGLPSMHLSSTTVNLLVLDLNSGNAIPLFQLPSNSGLASVAWSPDGSRLALVRDSANADATRNVNLSDVTTQDALGNLPPTQDPFLQNNVVDTVDFSSGKVNQALLKAGSGNGDTFGSVAWSTDGNTLATTMYVPSHLAGRANPIYSQPESTYLRFYTPEGQLLNTVKRDEFSLSGIMSPIFASPDELFIRGLNQTNVVIYYYNRTTGEFRQLPTAAGTASFMGATHQTHQVVFRLSSFTQAPEIFRLKWDGSALYELSFLNESLTQMGKVRADPVSFTLSNGQVRTGYILQATNAAFPPKNIPLVVWQEGGPTTPYLNRWATNVENPFNLLPNFGYAMLFVPLEGRYGFGTARLNALADNQNFGQIDIDEQAEIVQQLIGKGYTAAGKVGITGCSYGGYFTSQSITRHPDLYTAANTQCTLLDLYNEFQFGYSGLISYLVGATPMQDPARYTKISPLYNATKVKTPTLVFDGQYDFLPYRLSVDFQDQIAANGVATNVFIFNQEGHGLSSGHDQLIALQAQLGWFQQYLPQSGQSVSVANP